MNLQLSFEDLNIIKTLCLEPKQIRNPSLQELISLIDLTPLHSRTINVSQFPIIIIGKVQNPETLEIDHAGWVIQILGSIFETAFRGPHVVKLLANLKPLYTSLLPVQIPILVSSLSSFRKFACGVIDYLSFDRAAFLYIPQSRSVFRLWPIRCLLNLPLVNCPSCCLHHFLPSAPTYALHAILNSGSYTTPSAKRARPKSPCFDKKKINLKTSLERYILTILNSYFRQTEDIEQAIELLIEDNISTFESLANLQSNPQLSAKITQIREIWFKEPSPTISSASPNQILEFKF